MRREPPVRLLDNPILIAQARRRLRRRQAGATFAVVGVLTLCGVLLGLVTDSGWHVIHQVAFWLAGFALWVRAPMVVSSTIAADRASGILDFHRATPTTPATDAVGYLLGCPAREYLTAAIVLAVAVALAVPSEVGLGATLGGVAFLLLGAWLYHALSLLAGFAGSGRRVGQIPLLLIVPLLLFGGWFKELGFVALAYLTPLPALGALGVVSVDESLAASVEFFGFDTPPAVLTIIVQGYLLVFLLRGCARKMRRDDRHAFSRLDAFAFYAITLVVLLGIGASPLDTGWLGAAAALGGSGVGAALFLVGAVLVSALLAGSLAPSFLEVIRSTRRARRAGHSAPGWLTDGAAAWPLVPVFAGLTVAGLALYVATHTASWSAESLLTADTALAVAAAAAGIAFAVGAAELCRLKLRTSYKSGLMLVGFVSLVLPWILGSIALLGPGKELANWVYALSPVYAIGGAAARMAATWSGVSADWGLGSVGASVGLTAAAAAVMLVWSSQARTEATARL